MQLCNQVGVNWLLNNCKCLDMAIKHGLAHVPDLFGLEDIDRVMANLNATSLRH